MLTVGVIRIATEQWKSRFYDFLTNTGQLKFLIGQLSRRAAQSAVFSGVGTSCLPRSIFIERIYDVVNEGIAPIERLKVKVIKDR